MLSTVITYAEERWDKLRVFDIVDSKRQLTLKEKISNDEELDKTNPSSCPRKKGGAYLNFKQTDYKQNIRLTGWIELVT